MAHLILVRHGAPVIDESRPSESWPLADEGRKAVRVLSAQLQSFAVRAIACGPEPKMIGTAETLAERGTLPVRILPGLAEHKRASARFTDRAEFETTIESLFRKPGEIVFGEESADAVFTRFSQSVDQLLAAHAESVVAVSGGTAISLFVSRRSGVAAFPFWKSLKMPMALVLDRSSWALREILTP